MGGVSPWLEELGWAVAIRFVSDDLAGALLVAEHLKELLVRYPAPRVSQGVIIAIAAADHLGDEGALTAWVDRVLAMPKTTFPRTTQALVDFTAAISAKRDGDADRAVSLLADVARVLDEEAPIGGTFVAATIAHLERADLLVRAGDRQQAQRDLDAAVAVWRKGRATYFLARVSAWAEERGLSA